MYQKSHVTRSSHSRKKRVRMNRVAVLLIAILVIGAAVGSTVAYLIADSGSVRNQFTPSKVACQVDETFDGSVKENVSIKNTGDTSAYIRACIVATWKDAEGNVYGGGTPTAGTDYTISYAGSGWTQKGDYWYYTSPVAPLANTSTLITSCAPVAEKTPDGYALSVEIMAEAIQSQPATAVTQSWGVAVGQDGTIQ